MTRISVASGGAAAGLARAVFRQAGLDVAVAPPGDDAPSRLRVALNEATLALYADLFAMAALRSLARIGTPLDPRVVVWGDGVATRGPARLLLVPIAHVAPPVAQAAGPAASADGGATLAVTCRSRRLNRGDPAGRRFAFLWDDVPALPVDEGAAWTVASHGGWAFVAAPRPGRVMVQAIVPEEDEGRARAVATAARDRAATWHDLGGRPADFRGDAAPRLGLAQCDGTLRLGDEHLALDPLCGDGVGHALRAAALLAALVRGGAFAEDGAAVYAHRIRAAFVAHLRHCETHYASIGWRRRSWRAPPFRPIDSTACR